MDINLFAILATGIINMIVGSLWYGPLFGKKWMMLSGKTEADMNATKQKGMAKSYMLMFVGSLVMGYVMSYLVGLAGASSFSAGMQVGLWAWLGFVATVELGSVLWDGKPWKLYCLNASYHFVVMTLMGGVLAVWS